MELYSELLKQSEKIKANFFVPGHKMGRAVTAQGGGFPFLIDLTELDGTDNLRNPSGILKSAQERAAAVFGADKTFFLLNGSTAGTEGAILGATKRGDKILIDRCAHCSVISAVILGGLEPVFVEPDFDETREIYTGISRKAAEAALAKHPNAVGMVLTSPTYYGICSDTEGIAQTLHNAGKFLIVDEAHGAHFIFDSRLPKPALACGADAAIQSAHKTLPCPTQASLLHIRKNSLIDVERVFDRLKMLHTTSPSYVLMSALDSSFGEMADNRIEKLIDKILSFPEKLNSNISMLKNDDPTRMVFDVSKLNRTGTDAAAEMCEKFGIYTEMADSRYIVCVATIGNCDAEFELLSQGLNSLGKGLSERPKNTPLPNIELAEPPYIAYDKKTVSVSAEDAAEGICGEIVSVCPPGAAILIPGQIIPREAADSLSGQRIKILC